MNERMRVRLVVPSRISHDLAEWLEPLHPVERPDGQTDLTGILPDQTGVHALCNRLRDLGIPMDSLIIEREHPMGKNPRAARRRRTWQAWTLAATELIVACQALSGGYGLITNIWQLPTALLTRTPFHDWVGPGWLLILVVGVPHVLAATPIMFLPQRPRLGILAGYLAGGSLLLWIAMQLALLQAFFFLQPVIAVIGLLEIGLALWWQRRLHPGGSQHRPYAPPQSG